MNSTENLKEIIYQSPTSAGIYKMLNEKDEILYVGKAKNIHQSKKHFDKSLKNTILKIGSPPEEIAKSVKFLLESKSITGQFIAVDGGEHLS